MVELKLKLHDHSKIEKTSIIALIGKRNSGKSSALKTICYHFKDIIPRFIVVSPLEPVNNFYKQFVPKKFIYSEWNENIIIELFKSQEYLIKKYGKDDPRTHAIFILDDCAFIKEIWTNKHINKLFTAGRHSNITFIFTLQYLKSIKPELRTQVDYVFVYNHEGNEIRKVYDDWVGTFDSYKEFYKVFKAIVNNQYHCMVSLRNSRSSKLQDRIFYFTTCDPKEFPKFKTCHPMFWKNDINRTLRI